ncbi:peroxisomal assembly protein [Malassezia yamatoensis]|uniref:Peroxisomal ATPase PEX6 n=1 Tax=Malassezia yamatoensis TaxID=253288 RepID=A0AAJ5YVB5_9BASI|nr:peroxisomal assembly protein [Malassezia yamatoensis]
MALPYIGARVYAVPEGDRGEDVYLTASLLDALRHGEVSADPLSVVVASARDARQRHKSLSSVGILAWSLIAPPEWEDAFALQRGEYAVFVPTSYLWKNFQGVDSAAVRAVKPVSLRSAFLSVPSTVYRQYSEPESMENLQALLHDRILHSGESIAFPGSGEVGSCLVTEPVVQGRVDRHDTSIYLVDGGNHPQTHKQAPKDIHSSPSASGSESRSAPVLDSTFLERALSRTAFSENEGSFLSHGTTLEVECTLDIDTAEDAVAHWHRVTASDTYIDKESILVVTEATLANLAAFNGDWALVRSPGSNRPARLVRLLFSNNDQTRIAPTLAWNLAGDSVFTKSTLNLLVNPLPLYITDELDRIRSAHPDDTQVLFENPNQPPLMPSAESMCVARIASPVATDRALDDACLDALRRHLDGKPRILHLGDVFAVRLDSSSARFLRSDVDRESPSEQAQEIANQSQLPNLLKMENVGDAVYFCVTELNSHLQDPEVVAEQIPENTPALRSWYTTLTQQGGINSAGSYVDAQKTRIIQNGLETRRVPDVTSWLGLSSETPVCPQENTPLTGSDSVYERYAHLVRAALSPHAQRIGVDLAILLQGAAGSGKRMLTRWVAQKIGVSLFELNAFEIVADTDANTEGVLQAKIERAIACTPCILLLQNIDALAKKGQNEAQTAGLVKMLQRCMSQAFDKTRHKAFPMIFVGSTDDAEQCPPTLLACFNQTLKFDPPNEAERKQLLDIALSQYPVAADVDTQQLAVQTAALLPVDLRDLAQRARLHSCARLATSLGAAYTTSDLAAARPVLVQSDLDSALSAVRASYSESIGAPKIPNVTWDDVGGLASVKNEILDTVQLPLEHPELFSDGVKKRSGVLLYGPPGTGKTLLAKAVATTCSLNFFSVKGPELLNMYIGESEANVRRVFQRARDAKPCVIFFDELDSVAPKRGNQGDSGGVMDRIVSQLLAELDGMASGSTASDVFVIGATNRPDLLDPALLRPGRFDRMLYLSVAETHDAQRNILQALTRKFRLDEDVGDLSAVANQCPFNLTGADFYALCSDAMLKAMIEKATEIDTRVAELNAKPRTDEQQHWPVPLTPQFYQAELADASELQVRVHLRHFERALAELSASVSEQEMQHYREVQKQFSQPEKDNAFEKERSITSNEPIEKRSLTSTELSSSAALDLNETQAQDHTGSLARSEKGKGKGKSRE